MAKGDTQIGITGLVLQILIFGVIRTTNHQSLSL